MNINSRLLLAIVTVLLLVPADCRRTYSSRSSSSGRGNRGRNQPSGGGLFGSWFGGSKSSGSGSVSKPSASAPKKNWQTAASHVSSQPKPGWANPYYKSPGSASLPSAPRETNYGWKPSAVPNKPATSISGSPGYPIQSGVHGASPGSFGGYKPIGGASATNYQPSQSNFGGYRPAGAAPGHHPPAGHGNPGHQGAFGGYHPAPAPAPGYHPAAPSHVPSAGHHPSYPQQSFSGYQPSQSHFAGAVPTYQGTKLFGGNSGHYGYPGGGGGWGLDTYGSRKSSGTGKLLTGLAVGAAGGYLTSSLVNSISNPWKYAGYGYGSRYGYGDALGYGAVGFRDQSAFERGYERGARDRMSESAKEAAAPAPQPQPEDPASKWINCVAFDPQTQQTLINPNCSCTVTTSLDERTGQPISVHHCTTLNGLVMRPIPVRGPDSPPPASFNGPPFPAAEAPPSGGVNSPGAVPSYGHAYGGNGLYGAVPGYYVPPTTDEKTERNGQTQATETVASTAEAKTEESATEAKPADQSATGSVAKDEASPASPASPAENPAKSEAVAGGAPGGRQETGEDGKTTAEFYGRLQKIVNMGNFVDGG